MSIYYAALMSKSHAFLLERRMKSEGIKCELTFIPRMIMTDLCSMGVRFDNTEAQRAINSIRRSGLPGCKVYEEIYDRSGYRYDEVRV